MAIARRVSQMTVWIYVDTSKQVGDPDHLKVFASQDAAEAWFEQHDPEGVAFEYEVSGNRAVTVSQKLEQVSPVL